MSESTTVHPPPPSAIKTLDQAKWWIGKLRADLATKTEQWERAAARNKRLTLSNRELEVALVRLSDKVDALEAARIPITFENLNRASDQETADD